MYRHCVRSSFQRAKTDRQQKKEISAEGGRDNKIAGADDEADTGSGLLLGSPRGDSGFGPLPLQRQIGAGHRRDETGLLRQRQAEDRLNTQ